jgi:hypothetical protein
LRHRHEQRGQDGDNGQNNEDFHQRESTRKTRPATIWRSR